MTEIDLEKDLAEKLLPIKNLRLITPTKAQQLGFASESPVFVSNVKNFREKCRQCDTEYGPLVYRQHVVVRAHHFHEESGGIYYTDFPQQHLQDSPQALRDDRSPFYRGWGAVLNPLGRIIYGGGARTEGVEITQMLALCTEPDCLNGFLQEGLVYTDSEEVLRPICGIDTHPQYRESVRFGFRIDPENVTFNYLQRPGRMC